MHFAKVNYTFTIKSDAYGCETNVLRTIKMTLPMFNAYSQLDICTEIPDYYLCQEYVTQQVDGTTFYDRIATYKEKLDGQGEVVEDQNNTGTVNKIFKGASKFKYLIVPGYYQEHYNSIPSVIIINNSNINFNC